MNATQDRHLMPAEALEALYTVPDGLGRWLQVAGGDVIPGDTCELLAWAVVGEAAFIAFLVRQGILFAWRTHELLRETLAAEHEKHNTAASE